MKKEIEKKVIWNWDKLGMMVFMIFMFPFWIREVEYYSKEKDCEIEKQINEL